MGRKRGYVLNEPEVVRVYRAAMEYAIGRPVTQAELTSLANAGGQSWVLFLNAISKKGLRCRFSRRRKRWLVITRKGTKAAGVTLFHAVARIARREE